MSHPALLKLKKLFIIVHRKIRSSSCQFFCWRGPPYAWSSFQELYQCSVCVWIQGSTNLQLTDGNVVKKYFEKYFWLTISFTSQPRKPAAFSSTETSLPKPSTHTKKFPLLSANRPFYIEKQIVLFKIRLKFGYVNAINTACDFNTKHINLIINLFLAWNTVSVCLITVANNISLKRCSHLRATKAIQKMK